MGEIELVAALSLVIVGTGVTSLTAVRGLERSGVCRPDLNGDRFVVLRVLGTLLARLWCGVGLKLYSDTFELLFNRF